MKSVKFPGLSRWNSTGVRGGSTGQSERLELFLWIVTLGLVIFGMITVFSASSVRAFANEHGAFSESSKHIVYVLMGICVMWVCARLSLESWKRAAAWIFAGSGFLQVLVLTPLGVSVWGNRNWVRLGPITMQPSELLKLGMIVLLGVVISRVKERAKNTLQELAGPLLIAAIVLGLTLGGQDLGTAMIMGMILFGIFLFTGFSNRAIGYFMLGGLVTTALFVFTSENRMNRISNMFLKSDPSLKHLDWQPLHGTWALASGGLFGVGPGQSKAKWLWLPSADNDYIFSIIGEEYGWFGAMGVLLGFAVLFFLMLRVLHRARDRFGCAAVAGVMIWVTGQAFVNIAVVLRFLPVLGVPLPLISAGGSSLIACMAGVGLVISVARDAVKQDAIEPVKGV